MMLKKRSETKEELDCQAFQAQTAEHVTASQFYATCGNDYQGEFRAMESAWSQANGSQVLSKVAYDHTETSHVHLRSCAWLDACLHAHVLVRSASKSAVLHFIRAFVLDPLHGLHAE